MNCKPKRFDNTRKNLPRAVSYSQGQEFLLLSILLLTIFFILTLTAYAAKERNMQQLHIQQGPVAGPQHHFQGPVAAPQQHFVPQHQQVNIHPNTNMHQRFTSPANVQHMNVQQGNVQQHRFNQQNVQPQNYQGNVPHQAYKNNWNQNQNNFKRWHGHHNNAVAYPFYEIYTVFNPYAAAAYYDSSAASDDSYYYQSTQPNATYTNESNATYNTANSNATANNAATNTPNNIPNGTWVAMNNGNVANNAIVFTDADGNQAYYCRATYQGQLYYGELIAGDGCYVTTADQSATIRFNVYDVLVSS